MTRGVFLIDVFPEVALARWHGRHERSTALNPLDLATSCAPKRACSSIEVAVVPA
jgi:hypothetical protein